MGKNPLVSIVIVNFNAGEDLSKVLACLNAQTYPNIEIIVVDNASQDNSMQAVEQYPQVIRIDNSENIGFAAGQNQGFARAKGKYILALNYDLSFEPDFLSKFIAAFEQSPENVGWACPMLLSMGENDTASEEVYAAGHELPPNRFPLLRGLGENANLYKKSEFVFGAPGAAALYKRELIDDLSINGMFFDESFFTWCEDVDIDWRAQNKGWKCLFIPEVIAYHRGHVGEKYTEPFRSFRARLTIRNRWLMILENEKNPPWLPLIKYEFSLMIYVLRDHLVKAYLNALFNLISSWNLIRHYRKEKMKGSKVLS